MAMMIPYGQRVTPDPRTMRSRGLMRPRPVGRVVRIAVAALLALWFALPVVPLLIWSVANRWSFPATLPTEWGLDGLSQALAQGAVPAFGRSILLGLAVAAIATPLGALAARALTFGRVPAPRLVSAILLAPLALPAFVAVMGLTIVLLRAPRPRDAGRAPAARRGRPALHRLHDARRLGRPRHRVRGGGPHARRLPRERARARAPAARRAGSRARGLPRLPRRRRQEVIAPHPVEVIAPGMLSPTAVGAAIPGYGPEPGRVL